jgi:hypothetical protein
MSARRGLRRSVALPIDGHDIVEIMSALVEIRDKSIRFQYEMHKRRWLSHGTD